MAKIDRPTIVAGNDTTLYIQLKEYRDGEYVDDFDLDQVSDLKVELLCARDNYRYEIPYKIDTTYKNLIICDLKHTYYHTNTSYGIIVTGTNPDGKHWTWCMMPREGFLVVSNTSGLHLTDEAQQLSFNGLVGWGIKTEADLTNYYTKIEVNDLLEAKADTADLATVATTGDYNDLSNKPDLSQYATTSDLNLKQDVLISGENIKTINNQSLLGSGNIDIQGGGGESYTAGQNIDITNNVISTTNDIDAGTITAGDFKIKHTESGTVHYTRWTDTANRYLAEQAMHGNELRMGDQWYTYGNNATLYIDTQNDGVNIIPYTEWTYTDDIPAWMPGYITAAYKSATTVNGYPVYGAYNPDSYSPDFYIYDADNYGINSMWVDYVDIPSEKPLTYWKVKGKGMYVDIDNTTNVTFSDGDRQISIGTNNSFGFGSNVVMIGNGLTGEYMTEQLIVGRYNKEKNALFAVGNGHADSTFYSYSRLIDNDYTCTVWTELHEEFFNENGNVEFRVIKNDPEWTVLFECVPWLSISQLNDSNPYSENIEVYYQGTTYYGIATMQRDGNNLGVTFELYTDEQHTVPYNIFASPAEVDLSYVWFPISYKRDAFFVTEDGQIYIPHYEDINRTFNLGEAIFNLQQRPQPVQSDWNEDDATSLAYIQNKPTITHPVQSDWNEGDSSSLSYIQNKPTITQPVQSDWNETDTTSLAYIQNKPNVSEPGFIKVGNGLVNYNSTGYDSNLGNRALIQGEGTGVSFAIKASGYNSHAEGERTQATANNSHAEGYNSKATADNSHAEGTATTASAEASHSEGYFTKAENQAEHAAGYYNISTKVNYGMWGGYSNALVSSIGNGGGNNIRHNAFEVRQNGDIYYADTEKIDGSTVHYYDAPMRKLQDAMVTSTTAGVKIEVVSAMPATPDSNTLYLVV